MYLPLELELLQLTQFFPPAITSGASDAGHGWQCDPRFKIRVKPVTEEFAV